MRSTIKPWSRRNARVVAIAAGVAVAAAVTAAPAVAATSGPGLLTGVVRLAGEPVENAVVTLTLLRGLDTPKERHREVPLAVVTTDATGAFRIPLHATPAVLDAAALNSNHVNYAVNAFYDPRAESASDVNLQSDPQGTVFSTASLVYTTVVDTGALEPGEELVGTALASIDPVSLEVEAVAAADVTTDNVNHTVASDGQECRSRYAPWVSTVGIENRAQPVGEVHANYDMKAKFEYGRHANTDLSGAYQVGGGSWKASAGASHMGNKRTLTGATYGPFQAYVVKTVFEYRKEKLEFTDDMGDGRVCRIDYRIRATGWSGASWYNGADMRHKDSGGQMDAARGKGWAAGFDPRSYWSKNTSRTEKYTAGVSAFAVSLSAQSSWSNQVDIRYDFGPDDLIHWLYGSNGRIADAESVYAW